MYAKCYEGLGEKVIELLLPTYASWENDMLILAPQKNYSEEELKLEFKIAMKNIHFKLDSDSSTVSTYKNYGEENQKKISYTYLGGSASIDFFSVPNKA